MEAAHPFQSLAQRDDRSIDLAEGAFLIAAEAYPELDIGEYRRRLDALGETLKQRLRPDIGPTDAILSLNRYLFEELGYHGATEDYYDPRNSFLNDVLDRRIGIPITLSILYIAVGRRIGLALDGVSFPGHFLVRCPVHDGTVVLDPFHKGISLGIEDLRKRLGSLQGGASPTRAQAAAMLVPASKREILARLLRNLRGIYAHYNQWEQALSATSRILMLSPDAPAEWLERANLHFKLECFRAALDDYEHYLGLAPDAEDIEAIRARIVELQRACARLN